MRCDRETIMESILILKDKVSLNYFDDVLGHWTTVYWDEDAVNNLQLPFHSNSLLFYGCDNLQFHFILCHVIPFHFLSPLLSSFYFFYPLSDLTIPQPAFSFNWSTQYDQIGSKTISNQATVQLGERTYLQYRFMPCHVTKYFCRCSSYHSMVRTH